MEPKEGASVPILLWKIEALDEAALDRYEGWPHLYRKEMMDVELEGKSVSAMVYVMNDVRFLGMPLESYYKVIEEGYQTAGFDTAVLEHALARTEEMMEQENAQYHQQGFDDMDGFHLWNVKTFILRSHNRGLQKKLMYIDLALAKLNYTVEDYRKDCEKLRKKNGG